jgi:hypothetical protein
MVDSDSGAEFLLKGGNIRSGWCYPVTLEHLFDQLEFFAAHVRRRQVQTFISA